MSEYYIEEIKLAYKFFKSGMIEPESDDSEIDFEYEHALEFYKFFTKLLGISGPITIDTNILKHAYGLYDKKELKKLYPNANEKDDIIVIGEEDKVISVKDIDELFEKLLKSHWVDGRSYWLNGIYSSKKYRWVKNCDYAINWDS